MFIKICGIKREEDVGFVNEILPDYAGFVFAESKRKVSVQQARILSEKLDKRIKKVGVVINEIVPTDFLDVIQVHGDVYDKYHGVEVWKAVKFHEAGKYADVIGYHKLLIDGSTPGGGKTFDYNELEILGEGQEFILAGGLNHVNITDILGKLKKYNIMGVDVSGGVETDGVKDYKKIKQFVETVRNYTYS
jgi:phosphoribosylanthranilate isomerase